MNEDKLHYKLFITGRVQGVGFRFKARMTARYYGIFGIVKNLPDGSVYIEAEGKKEALEFFIQWCKKGPDYGMVKTLVCEKGELKGYSSFEVVF